VQGPIKRIVGHMKGRLTPGQKWREHKKEAVTDFSSEAPLVKDQVCQVGGESLEQYAGKKPPRVCWGGRFREISYQSCEKGWTCKRTVWDMTKGVLKLGKSREESDFGGGRGGEKGGGNLKKSSGLLGV